MFQCRLLKINVSTRTQQGRACCLHVVLLARAGAKEASASLRTRCPSGRPPLTEILLKGLSDSHEVVPSCWQQSILIY